MPLRTTITSLFAFVATLAGARNSGPDAKVLRSG